MDKAFTEVLRLLHAMYLYQISIFLTFIVVSRFEVTEVSSDVSCSFWFCYSFVLWCCFVSSRH